VIFFKKIPQRSTKIHKNPQRSIKIHKDSQIHAAFVDDYPAGRPLDWKKMHSLVRENKIDELENYKQHFEKTDENKENLFHSAAYSRQSVFTSLYSRMVFTGGNKETWTYLFDNGLKNINQENRYDTFPIQIACFKNNLDALKFLLDKKANKDVKVKV
jgi:ankyrin repeat protein